MMIREPNILFGNKRGLAMVAIILGMLIFGALGASTAYLATMDQASSNEETKGVNTTYIADGGLQFALQDVLNQLNDTTYNRDFYSLVAPGTINLGNGTFTVSFVSGSATASSRILQSLSMAGGGKRIVRQTVNQAQTVPDLLVARRDLNLTHTTGTISNTNGSLLWYGGTYSQGTPTFSGNDPLPNTTSPMAVQRMDPQSSTSFPTYVTIAQSAGNNTVCPSGCTLSTSGTTPRYYQGNLTIQPTEAPFSYTGLIYATGNITLSKSPSGIYSPNVSTLVSEQSILTSNGSGNPLASQITAGTYGGQQLPALVARLDVNLPSTANARINGLIWSGRDIILSSAGGNGLVLRGGLISQRDIRLDGINAGSGLTLSYDASFLTNIPGLLGGRYLAASNWQQ